MYDESYLTTAEDTNLDDTLQPSFDDYKSDERMNKNDIKKSEQ